MKLLTLSSYLFKWVFSLFQTLRACSLSEFSSPHIWTNISWLLPLFHLSLLFSGTSRRTKFFGTFPGNYVKRLWITLSIIYAAFQHHICITLPERSPQASCCYAFWFPIEVTHHHHLHLPPNHQQWNCCCSGETGGFASVWKCIFLPSALNFEKSICGIRKKIIILNKGWVVEAKK